MAAAAVLPPLASQLSALLAPQPLQCQRRSSSSSSPVPACGSSPVLACADCMPGALHLLCAECHGELHLPTSPGAYHRPIAVSPCQDCEEAWATLRCEECARDLCAGCADDMHKAKARRGHRLQDRFADDQPPAHGPQGAGAVASPSNASSGVSSSASTSSSGSVLSNASSDAGGPEGLPTLEEMLRRHPEMPRDQCEVSSEQIGFGSQGTVYAGRVLRDGEWVEAAVKSVAPNHQAAQDRQLLRELLTSIHLQALKSEHILTVYGYSRDASGAYLLLMRRYVHNLAHLLERTSDPLSDVQRVRLMLDLVVGLQAMHQSGVLHRDIKSNNVLVWRDEATQLWRACWADVGLARNLLLPESSKRPGAVGATLFMPPEVQLRQEWSPASDMYSLGFILRELCPKPKQSSDSPARLKVRQLADACSLELAANRPGLKDFEAQLRVDFDLITKAPKLVSMNDDDGELRVSQEDLNTVLPVSRLGVLCCIGCTGAGKSTLLSTMGRLLDPLTTYGLVSSTAWQGTTSGIDLFQLLLPRSRLLNVQPPPPVQAGGATAAGAGASAAGSRSASPSAPSSTPPPSPPSSLPAASSTDAADDVRVGLLDAEGTGQKSDVLMGTILLPAMLLSEVILFKVKDRPQITVILNQLTLLVNQAERLGSGADAADGPAGASAAAGAGAGRSKPALSKCFGHLVIAVGDDHMATPELREELLRALTSPQEVPVLPPNAAIAQKNKLKEIENSNFQRSLLAQFKSIRIHGLTKPFGEDSETLSRRSHVELSELRPEFLRDVSALLRDVASDLHGVVASTGVPMSGALFVQSLHNICRTLNNNERVEVSTLAAMQVEFFCTGVRQATSDKLRSGIEKLRSQCPGDAHVLQANAKELGCRLLADFDEQTHKLPAFIRGKHSVALQEEESALRASLLAFNEKCQADGCNSAMQTTLESVMQMTVSGGLVLTEELQEHGRKLLLETLYSVPIGEAQKQHYVQQLCQRIATIYPNPPEEKITQELLHLNARVLLAKTFRQRNLTLAKLEKLVPLMQRSPAIAQHRFSGLADSLQILMPHLPGQLMYNVWRKQPELLRSSGDLLAVARHLKRLRLFQSVEPVLLQALQLERSRSVNPQLSAPLCELADFYRQEHRFTESRQLYKESMAQAHVPHYVYRNSLFLLLDMYPQHRRYVCAQGAVLLRTALTSPSTPKDIDLMYACMLLWRAGVLVWSATPKGLALQVADKALSKGSKLSPPSDGAAVDDSQLLTETQMIELMCSAFDGADMRDFLNCTMMEALADTNPTSPHMSHWLKLAEESIFSPRMPTTQQLLTNVAASMCVLHSLQQPAPLAFMEKYLRLAYSIDASVQIKIHLIKVLSQQGKREDMDQLMKEAAEQEALGDGPPAAPGGPSPSSYGFSSSSGMGQDGMPALAAAMAQMRASAGAGAPSASYPAMASDFGAGLRGGFFNTRPSPARPSRTTVETMADDATRDQQTRK